MFRIALLIPSALLYVIVGCNGSGSSQTPLPYPNGALSAQSSGLIGDKDTYSVYDALLSGPSASGAKEVNSIVAIKDHTKVGISCSDLSTVVDPRLKAAGEDFVEQSSRERILKSDSFDSSSKVKVISSADLDGIFADCVFQGWAKFHKSYPDVHGYIDLSAVGFSADKNVAVVYSAIHCGPKCGTGGITALTKTGGVWKTNAARLCSWIS